MKDYPIHPAANLFPMFDGSELATLAEDIRKNGQLEPIALYKQTILDGRNRFAACKLAGVEPRFCEVDPPSPTAYVLSLNLHRRHLTRIQCDALAVRVKPLFEEEAREAQAKAAKETNTKKALSTDSVLSVKEPSKKPKQDPKGRSSAKAAKATGASREGTEVLTAVSKKAPEVFAAVEAGTVKTVADAKRIAAMPEKQRAEVLERANKGEEVDAIVREKTREARVEKLVEISQGNTALQTAQTYPIILADPPWRYEHSISDSRQIENQYPTMSLEEICALKVADICTQDAVLFLWATSPKLAESMDVLKAWGFEYKTCMVWVKDKIGMGYYARQKHEILLIATRGNPPTPLPENRPKSVFEGPREEHSKKPAVSYELVEKMYPELPKIELFCRAPREGWAVWGNQSC